MKSLRILDGLFGRASHHRGRVQKNSRSRRRPPRIAKPPAELLESRLLLSATAAGDQFLVAEVNAAVQAEVDVAVAENTVISAGVSPGDFVTVWTSFEQSGGDTSGFGVYAQLHNADGSAKGSAFLVNDAFVEGDQINARVAMDADGNFVVTWQSLEQDGDGYGIYARLYDNTGAAVSAAFAVNTVVTANQQDPSVAMDAGGNFVIAWESEGQDGDGFGIFARRFNASGTALDAVEFQVNGMTAGDQVNASVAASAAVNGDFVIAWEGPNSGGANVEIWARSYNSAGTILRGSAGELLVNQTSAGAQVDASAAIDGDGDFAISWTTEASGSANSQVFLRRFDASVAASDGSEVAVDATSTDHQHDSDIVLDAAGNLLVTWQISDDAGISLGTKGKAYNAAGTAIVPEFLTGPATVFDVNANTHTQVGINASGRVVTVSVGVDSDLDAAVFANRFLFDIDVSTIFDIVGPELTLNNLAGVEASAAVSASDENGNFVVIWQSYEAGADGHGLGIFGQLFDKSGAKIGAAFQVNTTIAGNQSNPTVAMSADGSFVVAWQGDATAGLDANGHGIYAQRFNADGVKLGGEILVNTTTAGNQDDPSIAMDADGNFVVVWESADVSGVGIFGRRFNANGTAASGQFQINSAGDFSLFDQTSPQVDMNYDGQFVVTWVSHSTTQPGIFAQWFNASGSASGNEVLVATVSAAFLDDATADVAINESGNFAVVWQAGNLAGTSREVFARTFTSAKAALQAAFQVNTTVVGAQQNPSVEADAAGNFIVTWQSSTEEALAANGRFDIVQRQFRSNGTALSGEFVVNTFLDGPQLLPVVFRTESGFFGTVWIGDGTDGLSADAVNGVNARLFAYTDISGWWIINGQAAQVLQMDGVVTLINEHGDVVTADFTGASQLTVNGWGGLVGTIVGNEIQWGNGSRWNRIPTLFTTATINGTSPVLVQQSGIDLRFTNERGETSEGHFVSSTQVVAEDWGNLVGNIVGNMIQWANGSVWTETDLSGAHANLAGAWAIGAESTTILQFGNSLLFVNEHGDASAGTLIDSTHVVATGWGNLNGTIDVATGRILWANGSVWRRVPVLNVNGNFHIDHHRPTNVSQLGTRFLFTNENGGRSEGRFNGTSATAITATGWSLGGNVDVENERIVWANGSIWNDSQFGAEDEVFADVNEWPWLV